TVKWQAAGADGHPMRGEFTFVLDPAAAPAGASAAPPHLDHGDLTSVSTTSAAPRRSRLRS
ncbi:MAG: copper resistance protein CopC, partial [Gemmatimonadetes bacterium]|nr:copper resistance protein CopC [Gemmatimonadota bacterium]